jgi:small subunit ribosomal protein S15
MQDKHSRKGLQEMVQRRKKYLKYLRRTDWDSYCLVLSKLGLRDVRSTKLLTTRAKQPPRPNLRRRARARARRER